MATAGLRRALALLGGRKAVRTGSPSVRYSSFFRQNAVTGEWVVYASGRSGRPTQLPQTREQRPQIDHDPDCPFCVGNEGQTPESTLQIGEGADWQLRVVPNRYPGLHVGGPCTLTGVSGYDRSNGCGHWPARATQEVPAVGHHEVLIHSRTHDIPQALEAPQNTINLCFGWRDRGRTFAQTPEVQYVTYFKNSGMNSGASLVHPHAQLVAVPVVPDSIWREQRHARDFVEVHGISAFEMMLDHELEAREQSVDSSRIIDVNDHFVSMVPYAARSPFEVWILPRFSQAHYSTATDDQIKEFGLTLHKLLQRQHLVLNNPDYNIVIRTAPLPQRGRQRIYNQATFYRWHAVVVPRLGAGAMAGFEIGSGIFSNGNLPEDDARTLREAIFQGLHEYNP